MASQFERAIQMLEDMLRAFWSLTEDGRNKCNLLSLLKTIAIRKALKWCRLKNCMVEPAELYYVGMKLEKES